MLRVHVVVEGQSEQSFVQNVLAEYFWTFGVQLNAPLLGVPGHKGGNCDYARAKKDILKFLLQEQETVCTTMLDYYALGPGFPGQTESLPTSLKKVQHMEQSLAEDIHASLPQHQTRGRFLPYFQLHEFEALYFSDPVAFAQSIKQPPTPFQAIRDQFPSPEDINNTPHGAPSKRIINVYPDYQVRKVRIVENAARAVGVETMRQACPHFRDWTDRLAEFGSPNLIHTCPK